MDATTSSNEGLHSVCMFWLLKEALGEMVGIDMKNAEHPHKHHRMWTQPRRAMKVYSVYVFCLFAKAIDAMVGIQRIHAEHSHTHHRHGRTHVEQ